MSGCVYVDDRRSAAGAPAATVRKTVRYMPPADQYVKSKLIDFDSPYDTTFLVASGVKLIDDPEKSGNRVMSAAATQIKLGSLVRGREFPGRWDLIGVRLRADRAVQADLSITNNGAPVSAAKVDCATRWAIQWIELKSLPSSMPAENDLLLNIRSADGGPILIDDVILAQSQTVLSRSTVPVTGESWIVRRAATRWEVWAGDRELFSLPASPFVESGYRVAESNSVRTVFVSPDSTISIDRSGRLIENGVTRLDESVLKFAKTTAENNSPALIEVSSDQGRVDRNLSGDLNNDGYDETRGCYTVRASGGRMNLTLRPQRFPVKWPVVEVIGLPPGTVNVWMEGQVVPWVTRLSDGKSIIELPLTLERGVEVQIRVK